MTINIASCWTSLVRFGDVEEEMGNCKLNLEVCLGLNDGFLASSYFFFFGLLPFFIPSLPLYILFSFLGLRVVLEREKGRVRGDFGITIVKVYSQLLSNYNKNSCKLWVYLLAHRINKILKLKLITWMKSKLFEYIDNIFDGNGFANQLFF